jgi:hypothetical protein
MLAGDSGIVAICFQQPPAVGTLLPSDLDGTTPPPAGEPNFFLGFANGANVSNSLALYRFHVDFNTPGNSTFAGPFFPAGGAGFTEACGGDQGTCVPQPGTTHQLDTLSDRPMYRLAYRNFGTYESLVVNHTVQVAASGNQTAIRWYEIRNPNGNPTVFQQGTYSPDTTTYRWMGSAAQDRIGDIAVGYSVSDPTSLYPSIRYTGRLTTDPLNTLQAESTIVTGSGSQTSFSRWGDYSGMSIDPADDCTFWYTTEYLLTTGSFNWSTRIASFKFSGCGANLPPPAAGGLTASSGNGQIGLAWNTTANTNSYNVYRSTTSGGPYALVTSTATPSYTDSGLNNGTRYFYVVAAVNSFGQSGNSNEASAIPTPPLPPPIISSVTPNSGAPAQNLANVMIAGSNFQNGANCDFGPDIMVNACQFISSSSLKASLTISSTATGGPHNVKVVNPDNQNVILTGGFYVTNVTVISGDSCGFSIPINGTAFTCTLFQPTGAGHALIIGMTFLPADIVSVTDDAGDTFTRGFSTSIFHNGGNGSFYTNFYYARNTRGGATTLTFTFSTSGVVLESNYVEVAGLDTVAPLDQSAYSESLMPATTWSSATITTSVPREYLFAYGATRSGAPACSNPAAGWTQEFYTIYYSNGTPVNASCFVNRITSSVASYQATVTESLAEDYAMEILSFKAGGPPSPPPPPGPISLVQKATYSMQPASSGTLTLTLPQTTGAGHALIVGLNFSPPGSSSLDISSVTDGSGDTFTRGLATSIYHNTSQGHMYTNFYYAKNTAGGTNSLTLNFTTGGSIYLLVAVSEVAGLDNVSPLDQSGYNESLSSTATPWSSASLATTSANEYLFAWASSEWTGVNCSSPTSGWTIESQINDPSGATVCFVDRIVSTTGTYQVTVTPGSPQNYAMELATFKGASSTTAPPPSVSSVSPNSGTQGQNLPSVAITGSNFQSGATCSFGAGITVNSCGFVSSTQLTANISISSTATTGPRNVTVTNPDTQTGTLTNGFSVTAATAPPPSVGSVSPNSGAQGQSLPSVTITGSNFQSGATCSFGAGISVNSCGFVSSTQLTANITISSTATVGSRNVTVTNPDGQSRTLANGFSVTSSGPPPPPTVTSVSPNSGTPGQNLPSVTINGSNFQSGATCSFGAGITVNSCGFVSSTQLTANISISSSAAMGPRNVTVTNPDSQTGTLTNGFTVTAPAAISLIQKATFSQQPSSSGTVTLTLPQATGTGDTLIVGVSFYPLDITSVTDGSGDGFIRGLGTSIFHNTSQGAMYTNYFYARNIAGGTTSLTLQFSGGSTYALVSVAEVAGLSSGLVDQSGYNESLSSTATPWSSATVTTTAANEYLFSWAASEWTGTSCSSPTSGWTIESQINDSSGATVCMVDQIVSATGSYQVSVVPGSPQNYAMELVTFR